MKTVLITAAALSFAAPAFANDGLEGRTVLPGEANAVTMTEQLAGGAAMMGFDANTVIRVNAAEYADDSLAMYSLRTAPETVSTQSFDASVSGQLLSGIDTDAAQMSLSDAVEAYLDEVAD